MGNDLNFLRGTVSRLRAAGLDVHVMGGWAEELHGLCRPRPHHDVDLLCRAADFDQVDALLAATPEFDEIVLKRLPHKRAFELTGVMVEIFLVLPGGVTNFHGCTRFQWPPDTFADRPGVEGAGVPLVSVQALNAYRGSWETLHLR